MPKIKILRAQDLVDAGRLSADVLAEVIQAKPDCLLGLATGSTPLPLYRDLIRRYAQGALDFSKVRTVNLDEYVGLSGDHPQSYRYFMNENLFQHINIDLQNTCVPDGMNADLDVVCKEYETRIDAWGGIDLQVLGIGLNGHIGFNEPATIFSGRTHVTNLAESTRQANRRFFESLAEVPSQAITMGIGSIMQARKILLICTGEKKSEILAKALLGPVDPLVPASILQFHPNVVVVADEPALMSIDLEHSGFAAG